MDFTAIYMDIQVDKVFLNITEDQTMNRNNSFTENIKRKAKRKINMTATVDNDKKEKPHASEQ